MQAQSLLAGIAAILLISNLDSSVLALGKPMLSPTPEEAREYFKTLLDRMGKRMFV